MAKGKTDGEKMTTQLLYSTGWTTVLSAAGL